MEGDTRNILRSIIRVSRKTYSTQTSQGWIAPETTLAPPPPLSLAEKPSQKNQETGSPTASAQAFVDAIQRTEEAQPLGQVTQEPPVKHPTNMQVQDPVALTTFLHVSGMQEAREMQVAQSVYNHPHGETCGMWTMLSEGNLSLSGLRPANNDQDPDGGLLWDPLDHGDASAIRVPSVGPSVGRTHHSDLSPQLILEVMQELIQLIISETKLIESRKCYWIN